MTEEQLADVKFRIRPHFLDYLNKAGMYLDCTIPEEMRTACPVCGRDAIIQKPLFAGKEHTWSCGFCGHKGNVIDYVKAYLDMDEQRAVSYLCRLLNIPLESLHTIPAAELMAKEFGPRKVLVEDLLTPGLYILAGAPKIGKSWLVLQLACFISKGLPLWDRKTLPCAVLYLALEDSEVRLQDRMRRICDDSPGSIFFSTEAQMLGQGFEKSIINHMKAHPDTGLIIVDTLAKIRGRSTSSNAYLDDYATMITLKTLADQYRITLLLVHHTRKMPDEDPMNRISGTNGLAGSADGSLVMEKPDRQQPTAYLSITGRDFGDARLELRQNQENMQWELVGQAEDTLEQASDFLLDLVCELVDRYGCWEGTAEELLTVLRDIEPSLGIKGNVLSRRLGGSRQLLADAYGIAYAKRRADGKKLILLKRMDGMSDMSD